MKAVPWTDEPPEPTPVRPGKARIIDSGTLGEGPPADPAISLPTSRINKAKSWSGQGWFAGMFVVGLIIGLGLLLYHPSARNRPMFNMTAVLQRAGLTAQDVCGWRGTPILSIIETEAYTGFGQYQAECANGATPTFMAWDH